MTVTTAPKTEPGTPRMIRSRRTGKETSGGERLVGAASQGVMWLWLVVVLAPLAWTLMTSFKTTREIFASPFGLPSQWNFDNYVNAWNTAGIGRYFFNTLMVVGSALGIVMLLGGMMAYALARFRFPGRFIIHKLVLAGMTFPIFLAVVPLFFTLQGIGLLNTLPGLIVTYVAYALPFTVFFLIPFFENLPDEIAEAAAIDGAGEWRVFFQVMLPMAAPGMASVAILNFVGLWNQFLLPLVLNSDPQKMVLTQGMQTFASQAGYNVDFGAMFAAAVLTILPVLLVYVLFQRQLLASVSQGAIK
ncbi:carbohydrate ABC transporter permease [Micromonospora sp. LZ34]